MGQGHYLALAFGTLDIPANIPDAERDFRRACDYDEALHTAAGRWVHQGYESARDYLAILVAENAGVEDETVTPETCRLADATAGPEWTAAREAWERAREASAKFGVELPEGEPLLIADYD